MSVLEELPFYNESTAPYTKNPKCIKTLMSSYGLKPSRFIYRFAKAGAYIGGSSATAYYLSESGPGFIPGDLDIYIKDTEDNRSITKGIIKCMKESGYEIDTENSFTDFLNGIRTQYTPDNNHINEIWSMLHNGLGKSVQIVLVDMEPAEYILQETDISCTSIAIEISTGAVKIDPINARCIKKRMIYINERYHDIYDGALGKKKKEKLMNRLEKYRLRGFKCIGKSSEVVGDNDDIETFMKFDKIPSCSKKFIVQSISDLEDISLYAALRRSNMIVIYASPTKGYAIDRQKAYEYANDHDKTYWGHYLHRNAGQMSCAPILTFSMYKLFTLRPAGDGTYMIIPRLVKETVSDSGIMF